MFLRLCSTEIGKRRLQLVAHLPVCVFRKANAARLADRLEARRDIDPVAHEVAIRLLDDVAEMDSDADLDALTSGNAGIAVSEPRLHLHGRAHGVDHAAELDHRAVAGALDDAPVMDRDRRVDQVAA